jgi:hypothetical protein
LRPLTHCEIRSESTYPQTVLEAAESLGAPIYLHPTKPPKPVIEASFGGLAPLVTEMLAGPGFGWHIETAVHGRQQHQGEDTGFPAALISAGADRTMPRTIGRAIAPT